jgi:hypothetical protein
VSEIRTLLNFRRDAVRIETVIGRRRRSGVILASAAAALITAQAENPQIGFWKMNMTKSTLSTGRPE